MGQKDMGDHAPGSWMSYTIYAAGLSIGALSPEQWLVVLSLIAVLIRIIIDLPKLFLSFRKIKCFFKPSDNCPDIDS